MLVVAVFLFFLCVCILPKQIQTLRIALHAQVFPAANSTVVGSVVTTDGLKAAFLRRPEVTVVETFYPFEYAKILDHKWDMILIEGWFPMINHFIELSRNHVPETVIIFYCLDPTYPSFKVTASLDVDGFMTNSRHLYKHLSGFAPTIFLMLAADEEKMKPLENVTKEYAAVYVGAGGPMLEHKPTLISLLEETVPFGLNIYGSAWDKVPSMSDHWKGPLNRDDIAIAYAGAEIVLASTIKSQASHGMINNRIFEALSCGAIVVSDYFKELADEFRDVIMIANETKQVGDFIRQVIENPTFSSNLRLKGRQIILKKHTWSHRVIKIVDFYGTITQRRHFDDTNRNSIRPKAPKLAWIVSSNLLEHPDYAFGIYSGLHHFTKIFDIYYIDASSWLGNCSEKSWVSSFDVLISIVTLFDDLDTSFRKLPRMRVKGKDEIQRRACFMIGFRLVDQERIGDAVALHYDVIWYRSPYEQKALESLGFTAPGIRLQHSFGTIDSSTPVDISNEIGVEMEKLYEVIRPGNDDNMNMDHVHEKQTLSHAIICIYNHISSCSSIERQEVEDINSVLILLGGTLDDWINDDNFLGFTPLSRIILAKNYSTDLIISMLKVVTNVTFIHEIGTDDVRFLQSDALWPFVYPLTLGKNVATKHSNVHMDTLHDVSCENWDGKYREKSIKVGLARLFGLGVATSSFKIFGPNMGSNITSTNIPLEIEFNDFEPGKDGRFCIVYKSKDIICIIRPVDVIILRLSQENKLAKNVRSQIEFTFECRGNMFNDKIYTKSTQYYLDILQHEVYSECDDHCTIKKFPGAPEAFFVNVLL